MGEMASVGAFLERISYGGPLTPSAQTLRSLHRATMLAVPFENLDIHLGKPLSLREEVLEDKIVGERRGGFCFELNGLFASVLRQLGFDVTLLSARVFRSEGFLGPEFDHLTLLVRLEEPWLVDVGFGDSFSEPLRLDDPGEQRRDGSEYRIARADGRRIVLRRFPATGWQPRYRFTLAPRRMGDFEEMCLYHQTSPESVFTRHRICTRATRDGRVTLRDDLLIRVAGGERRETRLSTLKDCADALKSHFGVDLGVAAPDPGEAGSWFP